MLKLNGRASHYYPDLRCKTGECIGLLDVQQALKSSLRPIFVIVPPGEHDPETRLIFSRQTLAPKQAKRIRQHWNDAPCFVSCEVLNDNSMQAPISIWFEDVWRNIRAQGVNAGIAETLNRIETHKQYFTRVFDSSQQHLMIICEVGDLASRDLNRRLISLAKQIGVAPQKTTVMVRVEGIDLEDSRGVAEGIAEDAFELISDGNWRDTVFQISNFPRILPTSRFSVERIPRLDIAVYAELTERLNLPVSFSDFPAENSIIHNMSKSGSGKAVAHLRYLSDDHHLIFGGRAPKKKSPTESIHTVADRLVRDPEFDGAWYSKGDLQISLIADQQHTGRSYDWRASSVTHHITKVVEHFGFAEIEPLILDGEQGKLALVN